MVVAPRSWWWLVVATAVLALVSFTSAVAAEQPVPGETGAGSTVAPTPAPPATPGEPDTGDPLGPQPTSPPSSTTPPAEGSPDDDPVPEQPPMADGAELPDPPAAPGPPVPDGGAPSTAPGVDAGALDSALRRLESIVEPGLDAVAAARLVEADVLARLDEADADLAEARSAAAIASTEHERAQRLAASAKRRADAAQAAAADADAALQRLAVAAYLDPPQELQVAALQGRAADRATADALVAAQAELLGAAQRRLDRAEHAARVASGRAGELASRAESAVAATERTLATLQSAAAARARVVTDVRALLAVAEGRVLGFVTSDALAQRLSVEAVTASGVVIVDTGPTGAWSVTAVGFPAAADIVRVPGTTIRVHRLIAGDVAALIAAAAADGVRLDGWGHRDALRQIELRRAHCGESYDSVFLAPSASCAPPTARPGRSMHERGLAVDFANCASRATPCHRWLAQHAAAYGLFNLPSEPWHWSTNGN